MRAVEALVQDEAARRQRRPDQPSPAAEKDADTRAFEKDLSDSLGLKVEIKPGSGESGALTINYGNFDQLDYLRDPPGRPVGPLDPPLPSPVPSANIRTQARADGSALRKTA